MPPQQLAFSNAIHPRIRLFLWTNLGFSAIHPRIRLFLWTNLGFSAIHPHLGLFLWRNLGFSAIHPRIRLFLWRNFRISYFRPHIGLFLWTNLGFSAIHPHIGLFLWMNLGFLLIRSQQGTTIQSSAAKLQYSLVHYKWVVIIFSIHPMISCGEWAIWSGFRVERISGLFMPQVTDMTGMPTFLQASISRVSSPM